MKKATQALLQRLLGFERYLFFFARFKIATLRWDSQRQEGDFNHFLRLLGPHFHVLDIGANIGIMTVLMARRCRAGRVYAFEPVPDNCHTLGQVVTHYRLAHVEIHPVALGPGPGEVAMAMPVIGGVRMQGLSHVVHQSIDGYDAPAASYRVQQVALDDWPFEKGTKIHAIKMDVENYEQYVLEGAMQLIARDKPLIYCELWDNANRRRCFELLEGAGYEVRVRVKGLLVPFEAPKHSHHNFFFLPKKP